MTSEYAVARKTLYWMLAGVMITVVILAYAFILGSYSNRISKVPPSVEAEFISLRFINTCFAYEDTTNTIDLTKFTQENMDKCYKTDPDIGFKDMNFELVLEEKKITTNNYFNKIDFTLTKLVRVWDGSNFKNSRLTINVQEKI